MKSAESLKARLGAHMKESMGMVSGPPRASSFHGETTGSSPAPSSSFHGETTKYVGAARVKDALAIEVDRLSPDPDQPRKEFDPQALADLAASLKARGQLQPIRVRWDDAAARWVVIAGERRYRAAKLAGLSTLMCIEAKASATADDLLEDQLVENCIREDLKPIEQAVAFKTLLERRGWSYRQLGEALHVAPASIARALALLELPTDLQDQVTAGQIPASTAYEVSRIENPEVQRAVAHRAVSQGLNRAEVAEAARRSQPSKGKTKSGKARARRTSASFRTSVGKVTIEGRREIDDHAILTALREALAQIEAQISDQSEAA